MFLNRFRVVIRSASEERGSVLMGVIGLMAVTLIISAVIAASTINALSFTSATRAGVQSVSAAESGINQAVADVQTGSCPTGGIYSSNTDPVYTVQLSWSTHTDLASATWTMGCPTSAAQILRIESTGEAAVSGVVGNDTGDVSTVEAIYRMTLPAAGVPATGAAVYAFSSAGFSGSGTLTSSTGTIASVQIRNGDVACSGASPTYADIVVANGKFTGSGSCTVAGSVWASQSVAISGGVKIGANAIAGTTMDIQSDGKIGGSVWAPTSVKISWGGEVAQNANSNSSIILAGGNVKGTVWSNNSTTWSGGGLSINGRIITRTLTGSGTAHGGVTQGLAWPGVGPTAPPAPTVPNWIEFNYDLADWNGFLVRTLTGACNYTALKTAIDSLGAAPGVIDARACTGAITLGGDDKITLSSDVAIFAKGYSLGGSAGFLADSPRKLWLIVPDELDNGLPTCVSGRNFTVGGGFILGAVPPAAQNISALVYSPCESNITSGIHWRGQLYGQFTKIDGNAKLMYSPVGLPGVNMDTGDPVSPGGPVYPVLSSRESIRDVAK
ncbi:hypothetical protein [Microterricola viridarii]|uniref:Uncharacterized protein n=1 Tax=Microterricola viridarii TaxID=412690 RepID=A0A1H1PY60_9MICO|nr:hypothetical protein [Microterricola viridarii]SDS15629.1 hypothetical protein SAMN04489834_0963 [Microterricola viridarii]